MVRVERSSASVERITLPEKCSSVAFTRMSAGSPSRTLGGQRLRHGNPQAQNIDLRKLHTGSELTLEVPAWISDPVSA